MGLISNATTGNITMAATGTIGINTLKFSDTNARTIDVRNSTTQGILRLGSGSTTSGVTEAGGILIAPGSGALTIGVAGTPGTISGGSATTNSTGDLIFINQSSNAVTVNSIIANNGSGAPALVNSGSGKVILAGANTWTGVMYLNSGTLEVATVNLATAAGPLGKSSAG
ncbi:MAG: hypothetical protein EBU04_11570, partial [Verrucomicrobia bacterium]|nr:hypothetical protein [Verrucomicrobiota bacterium]